MKGKFNASISVVGISEPKVQQAILKLLENSRFQNSQMLRMQDDLREDNRLLRQRVSTLEKRIGEIVNLQQPPQA